MYINHRNDMEGHAVTQLERQIDFLANGGGNSRLQLLYGNDPAELAKESRRYADIAAQFAGLFGGEREVHFFSAPGRTEIGGNHTDHQHGRVLAAAVNLDIVAAASKNEEMVIRLKSAGFPSMDEVDISRLNIREEEKETSASLLRGICARISELGYRVGGFDAYTASQVLKGSGLSSSAAFEILVVTIINHLYNDGKIDPVQAAKIAQYAENVYFGKPSGLMDQTASSVGGFVAIDFERPEAPKLEKVNFNPADAGYALCIVDTGGNHADLTCDYAEVPLEMTAVARAMGHEVLRECDPSAFQAQIPQLRAKVGDRAVLRAIHFFAENERVQEQTTALRAGDFEAFKQMCLLSGQSSYMYLQNVYSSRAPKEQGISLALALSQKILQGRGAWRVHGGGFAGTMQAFVPYDLLAEYRSSMEVVFGAGHCYVLSIRQAGGIQVF